MGSRDGAVWKDRERVLGGEWGKPRAFPQPHFILLLSSFLPCTVLPFFFFSYSSYLRPLTSAAHFFFRFWEERGLRWPESSSRLLGVKEEVNLACLLSTRLISFVSECEQTWAELNWTSWVTAILLRRDSLAKKALIIIIIYSEGDRFVSPKQQS